MTRVYAHDNVVEAFNQNGDGIPAQFLGGLVDVIFAHNTFANAGNQAVSFDGGAGSRTVIHSSVLPHGAYGVKGSGTGDGTSTLNAYMPGGLFATNAIVGGNVYPNSCGVYPAGTLCPASALSPWPLGYDGRAIGADVARVDAATAGAVVSP
jgi:hypothetical protein